MGLNRNINVTISFGTYKRDKTKTWAKEKSRSANVLWRILAVFIVKLLKATVCRGDKINGVAYSVVLGNALNIKIA